VLGDKVFWPSALKSMTYACVSALLKTLHLNCMVVLIVLPALAVSICVGPIYSVNVSYQCEHYCISEFLLYFGDSLKCLATVMVLF